MSRPSRPTQPVRYPTSYIRELSPAWLRYVAAGARCDAPDLQAPFRYLELGCGTGLSTLLHAAAYPGARFHACEADPACVEQMRRSMKALRIGNLHVHHAPFSALAGAALPAMDFIVLHGVVDRRGRAPGRPAAAA